MDALGHFAVLPRLWDGKSDFPSGEATYYGGHTQGDVKPTSNFAAARIPALRSAASQIAVRPAIMVLTWFKPP